MAWTANQLQQISDFVVYERQVASSFMKAMNQMNILNDMWNSHVAALIGTPSGIVLSDSSNYAGSVPLTDTDAYAILGYFQAILTAYDDPAHRQEFDKAAGTAVQ